MSKKVTKSVASKAETADTKPLTRDQINHSRRRVEAIAERHIIKIRAEDQVDWSRSQNLLTTEIAAGRFTVKPKSEIVKFKSGDDLHNILNFKNFPKGMEDAQDEIQRQQQNWKARIEAVEAIRDKIIDDLILGDACNALRLIGEFEAREF